MEKNKQLTIKDLQKGMMVKVRDNTTTPDYDLDSLVIDYVRVNPDLTVGASYAVGYDDDGEPWILTNHYKIILAEEKDQDTHLIPVVCSYCGQQMEIKEWMQANEHHPWTSYPDGFKIPAMNKRHTCKCGKHWTWDDVTSIGNILICYDC